MVNTKIRLIVFFPVKDGKALYSQQKQDLELTMDQIIVFLLAKFRFKLKNAGKATTPSRYDLSQIRYDYTLEVMNRFKGLEMVDRVPEELWTEVCIIV